MTTPLSAERLAEIRRHVMHEGPTDLGHVIGTALMAPELLAEVERLRSWLRECSVAMGGDGSDDSLLGLVYCCGAGNEALKQIGREQAELDRLHEEKDRAYGERDRLVAALSKVFPSHLCRHPDEDTEWDTDWRWIVCIHLPTGQATWHIHDSERHQFNHLSVSANHWDGHTTEEKYRRLDSLPESEAEVDRLRACWRRPAMTAVADMVAEWLREHGYDGLTNGEDCACLATDDSCPLFSWCLTGSEQSSGAGSVMCVPGHKVMRGSEWDIVPDEEATDDDATE